MVYLHYISCLRYTILVGNPRYVAVISDFVVILLAVIVRLECVVFVNVPFVLFRYEKQTVMITRNVKERKENM